MYYLVNGTGEVLQTSVDFRELNREMCRKHSPDERGLYGLRVIHKAPEVKRRGRGLLFNSPAAAEIRYFIKALCELSTEAQSSEALRALYQNLEVLDNE